MASDPNLISDSVKAVAYYGAIGIPATVAITNLGKFALEWLKQRHLISTSRITQTHDITTEYLNRALDPSVPLAIRYQLLRFLATPDKDGNRLNMWAKAELERSEFELVELTNKAFMEAEKALLAAKTTSELAAAEKDFAEANKRRRSLLEPPRPAPLTAAALRAGLIESKDLPMLEMTHANLRKITLHYRNLKGADFSGSDLSHGSLQGCDLRLAKFNDAVLHGVVFYDADLRGADFKGSKLQGANLKETHLEAADFTGAEFGPEMALQATYDGDTKWPVGFDPVKAGGVDVTLGEPEPTVTEKSDRA
jgi:uncharacterized protein YjbI with pentapeptide repeats